MKIKILLKLYILLFLLIGKSLSDEIKFNAKNIDIKNDGNVVIAYDSDLNISEKDIKIKSNKAIYDKSKNIIEFFGDVYYEDLLNNLTVSSNTIVYFRDKNLIFSEDLTKINLEEKYFIEGEKIYYDRNLQNIYSYEKAIIKDVQNNIFKFEDKYNFDLLNEIIKSNKSYILDNEDNKYYFEDLFINLKSNEIVGKEIKVEYEDSYFGNEKNDPILKGRSSYSSKENLQIYKAVFSTCNTDNKKCRGWELNTEEFNHDKVKKIFEYKNSWLKIFDYNVLYFPYFSHPDPSVKRKSGFLVPSYSSSNTLGNSFSIPYFNIISNDKDITFNPKFYADKSFMLQNEYRQVLKNSKVLSDFSFLIGEHGTKSHFFYNQIGEYNSKINYEINLQDVKGDNYLKTHSLNQTSKLIERDDYLVSNLIIKSQLMNSRFNASFKIFENLTGNRHDRYTYVFPDFEFIKDIDLTDDYNGSFNFSSSGNIKNYETNVTDATITNDFLFESDEFVNKFGFSTNYDVLIKNYNYYADNPNDKNEDSIYDVFGIIKIDSSLPLQKKLANNTHYLKPIASFRYSPNGNTDLSNKDTFLNYNNVFSLNRIGTTSEVEGGAALSLGLEFKRSNNLDFKEFEFKLANVLKLDEDYRLPTKSKLNKTRTDIFGNAKYSFDDINNIEYIFSYDRDLKYSNLDQLILNFGVNNLISKFEYYTTKKDIGNEENIRNTTTFNLNDENNFKFVLAKDLKEDFTEFYDLIYTYKTDCISFNLGYNKSFYRDGNLEPSKSLSFLIKIIPFSEFGVANMKNLIGK